MPRSTVHAGLIGGAIRLGAWPVRSIDAYTNAQGAGFLQAGISSFWVFRHPEERRPDERHAAVPDKAQSELTI